MREIDIHACHAILLKMAALFDQFCRDHQIPYFMLGGTMLGAVRHKGFIPWDDDMDFGIPRPYYSRFVELASRELPADYSLQIPTVQKKFVKIVYNRSHVVEKLFDVDDNTPCGISIDIFPLDGADSRTLAGRMRQRMAFYFLRLQEARKCSLSIRSGMKKVLAYLIKQLPLKDPDYMNFIDRWIQTVDYETAPLIANYYGNWMARETMDRAVFEKTKLYNFDGITLVGVEDADTYLRHLYDDYMQMPPLDQQATHTTEIWVED